MFIGLESCSLQTTATFRVNGLIEMLNGTARPIKLDREFAGIWSIGLELPGTTATTTWRNSEEEEYLLIHVRPSWAETVEYGYFGVLTISVSLESLDGEVQRMRSFEWDVSTDHSLVTGREIRFMRWSSVWKNSEIRRTDGFRIILRLDSLPPPTRPVIDNPLILNNFLELMDGQDVIDTKFYVFSRKRLVGGKIGAMDPLPVYVTSAIVREQCAYFESGELSL
jgi:hypothetical protein